MDIQETVNESQACKAKTADEKRTLRAGQQGSRVSAISSRQSRQCVQKGHEGGPKDRETILQVAHQLPPDLGRVHDGGIQFNGYSSKDVLEMSMSQVSIIVFSQMIWIEDVIHYSHHNTWEADYNKHTNEYHEACHLLLNGIRYRIGRQHNQGTINSIQIYGR